MRLSDDPGWLAALRRYLGTAAALHLVWEFAHMPLYTLWRTGSAREIVFAALHCTGGDLVIAAAALVGALAFLGSPAWPAEASGRIAGAATALGLGYTIISEHVNTAVRGTWAYTELMPTLPLLGTGLSPVAQWLIVPGVTLVAAGAARPVNRL